MPARSAEPAVIYAQPAPVRTASAQRSMGGGFIEFLFSDGPSQPAGYEPRPSYQARPGYEPRGLRAAISASLRWSSGR